MFYVNIQGIVFVIDGSDTKRIKIVKELIEKLDKDLTQKIPIAFLINKQDINGALNKNEIQEFIDLDRLDTHFIWTIK
jgi:signal recognition particle receptor subunit beta